MFFSAYKSFAWIIEQRKTVFVFLSLLKLNFSLSLCFYLEKKFKRPYLLTRGTCHTGIREAYTFTYFFYILFIFLFLVVKCTEYVDLKCLCYLARILYRNNNRQKNQKLKIYKRNDKTRIEYATIIMY